MGTSQPRIVSLAITAEGFSSVSNASDKLRIWCEHGAAFLRSPRGVRVAAWGRRLLFAGIVALLWYQLRDIGWGAIWHSLPSAPLFYAAFLVLFCQQPLFYTLAYRLSWKFRFREGLAALFKMCVYNNDVLGNLGEVYLYVWAEKRLGLSRLAVLRTIKDNAILSWIWDTVVTLALPGLLVLTDQVAPRLPLTPPERMLLLTGLAAAAILLLVSFALHRKILAMPTRGMAAVSAVYFARLVLLTLVAMGQWAAVLPGVPLESWLTLAALRNLINWIPLLPSNDLLFVGAGVSLAEMLGIPAAPFAGMLLMTSALQKLLNAVLFTTISLADRAQAARPEPAVPMKTVPVQSVPLGVVHGVGLASQRVAQHDLVE